MIKRILPLLLIIMICGCSNRISLNNQLKDVGYSQEEIDIIFEYSDDVAKVFLPEYNKDLLEIIKDDRFVEDNISEYAYFYDDFDKDSLFKLINEKYLTNDTQGVIKTLYKQKYFILDNIEQYLEYRPRILDFKHLIAYVNVGAYKEPYDIRNESDISDEMTVLANKWNYLGKYEPTNLIIIEKKYGQAKFNQPLKEEAYEAFKKMHAEAKKEKINLFISSAYRAHDYQEKIYNNYLKIDPQEVVDTYSSRPGFSDHQTGLACDILSKGYDFDTFEKSKAFKWLSENAEKFGFILRYPKDKEDITGYIYESWHYRYVGEELAKFINDNNLTYDEYHAYYVEQGLSYK